MPHALAVDSLYFVGDGDLCGSVVGNQHQRCVAGLVAPPGAYECIYVCFACRSNSNPVQPPSCWINRGLLKCFPSGQAFFLQCLDNSVILLTSK